MEVIVTQNSNSNKKKIKLFVIISRLNKVDCK